MPKEQKVYGRYILEFVAEDIHNQNGVGIHQHGEINATTPKEIRQAIQSILNNIYKNLPLLMMSISDEEKGRRQ